MKHLAPAARRAVSAGFTLIELLVVIGILSVLMVALLPQILESQREADVFADKANLEWHYKNIQMFQNRKLTLPRDGGAKYVLAPWVKGVCDKTPENRDRYFIPGLENANPRHGELAALEATEIWQDYDDIMAEDTDYAGRASEHYKTMKRSGNEALMASVHPTGTINVLMASGSVRTLQPAEAPLADHWDPEDPDFYIDVGPDCPIDYLQKLTR